VEFFFYYLFFYFALLEKSLVFLVAFALFRVRGLEIFEVNEWFVKKKKFMILSLNLLFLNMFSKFSYQSMF